MAAPSPSGALLDEVTDAVAARNMAAVERVCGDVPARERALLYAEALFDAATSVVPPWEEGLRDIAAAIQSCDGRQGRINTVCRVLGRAIDARSLPAFWALLALLPASLPARTRSKTLFFTVIHNLLASLDLDFGEWPAETVGEVVAAIVARATAGGGGGSDSGTWNEADFEVACCMGWLLDKCIQFRVPNVALAALRALPRMPRRLAVLLAAELEESLQGNMPVLPGQLSTLERDATWDILALLHAARGLYTHPIRATSMPFDDTAPPPRVGMDVPSEDEGEGEGGRPASASASGGAAGAAAAADDSNSDSDNERERNRTDGGEAGRALRLGFMAFGLPTWVAFLMCGGLPTRSAVAFDVLDDGFKVLGMPDGLARVVHVWLAAAEAGAGAEGAGGAGGVVGAQAADKRVARPDTAVGRAEEARIFAAWTRSVPAWAAVTLTSSAAAARSVLHAVAAELPWSWRKRAALLQLRAVARREAQAAEGCASDSDDDA